MPCRVLTTANNTGHFFSFFLHEWMQMTITCQGRIHILSCLLDQKAAANDSHPNFYIGWGCGFGCHSLPKLNSQKSKDANEANVSFGPFTYIAREVNRRQYLPMSILCICNAQRNIAIHWQWQDRSQQQARNRGSRQYETSTDTLVSWYCGPVLAFHKWLTLVCVLSDTCW